MQAVILAAGLGSRIRDYHDLPKGFIRVGEVPIIAESIHRLKQHGIDDILIVTGYRSELYELFVKKFEGVSTLFNPDYAHTGSLRSLYSAKDWVQGDILVLESDLLYESRAIDFILKAEQLTAILLSGPTYSDDEVYVEANQSYLVNMSKDKAALNSDQLFGEFVGINKLSFSDYQQLVALVDNDPDVLGKGHYEEHGFVALTQHRSVYCLKVPDLLWCEIDTQAHLESARNLYPKLSLRNNAMQRNILLNPGPVTTTQSVKEALLVPDICHREKEFTELLRGIRHDLLKVVNAKSDYTSVLFTASGTGAIEACITSIVPQGKKIAVINNGSYGQRMINIARRYGIDVVDIPFSYDQTVDLKEVEAVLLADPDIAYLAMVHHETSSGILNPLREVGALCHRISRGFIVDAMSSFAGTDIDVYKDHIDFIMSSSNKCLHGMPGLSFVVCNKKCLFETEDNARSYYLDLHQQYHALEDTGQMPFTPAIQVAYSLRQALNEFFEETLEERIKRYRENHACLIDGLESLGFSIVTPKNRRSEILVTVRFPEDGARYDFDALHDLLYKKGYTIYPKKIAIDHTFRLACIGDLSKTDIQNFLQEVKAYLGATTHQQKDLI